ncbi:MAG: 16S rRNA processing protein RimM [Muribaculaceae bacterium]|nr:16S rRNA processing protein RimM [Muribaculaceae bacterium]
MIIPDEVVEIGQYNKPHGIAGELSATFPLGADVLEGVSAIISPMDGILVPFFIEKMRGKSNHTLLLTIAGIDSEDKAKRMVNKPIFALRCEVPETDEVYCDYFIGFSIEDEDGNVVGDITDIDDTTENALFVVDADGNQIFVPISENLILEIDDEKKVIIMELPQGLIDAQINNA